MSQAPVDYSNLAIQVTKPRGRPARQLGELGINILPIPVLDGGHIFFLAVEKLKGKPVSGDVMIWAQWIGLACILGLMALVFFNDITRLLGN